MRPYRSARQASLTFPDSPPFDRPIRNRVIAAGAALVLSAVLVSLGIRGDRHAAPARRASVRSLSSQPDFSPVPFAGRPPVARGPSATVTLGKTAVTVPPSYLGISTEYWAMPLFEHYMSMFERLLRSLQARADGPLLLRIGGDSADHAIFDPNLARLPNAVFELTPRWFRRTGLLPDDVGARMILDLNLVIDRPLMAALWVRAAQTDLPSERIAAYEIGNEPDIYNPFYWFEVFQPIERVLQIRLFNDGLTPDVYDELYTRYAQVLARFATGVPLAAPVVAYPVVHRTWIRSFLGSSHPNLGIVSAHMYPYSACAKPSSRSYPTVAKLLSERATAGMANSLAPLIRLVHRAGFPFQLTELNSVTCGGVAGVSDTFATALWAPDALFELLGRGVNGVNVHVRAYTINAAFAIARHSIVARPLLYGLILFARMLGPHAQLMQVRERTHAGAHLKAWAVEVSGDELHVLLINRGKRSVKADLVLPSRRLATIQRLLAPSAAARSGVTLRGQQMGSDGTWHGRPVSETVIPGARGYVVIVAAISAALLTVRLASPLGHGRA